MADPTLSHKTVQIQSGDRVKGKIALVSGGCSGIGRSVVDLFVAQGARIVIIDMAKPAVPLPDGVEILIGSVLSEEDWQKAVDLSLEKFGQVPNVLVQSAGISGRSKLHECSLEEWNRTFGVNSTGVMLGMKTTIKALLEHKLPGSIINISSVSGIIGSRTGAAYEASKGACTQMSRSTAVDYAPYGIRVNAVHPGPTWTEMIAKTGRPQEEYKTMFQHVPLNRWGTPVEVAYNVLYLASDESGFVTGATVMHDGGFVAC